MASIVKQLKAQQAPAPLSKKRSDDAEEKLNVKHDKMLLSMTTKLIDQYTNEQLSGRDEVKERPRPFLS